MVKWGKCLSNQFPVLRSVRQGGILSAFFFSVYMDNLSDKLSNTGLGCRIRNIMCNNYFYADDICILTSSIQSLKKLLLICEEYAYQHDLIFNPSKSVCQVFGDYHYDFVRPVVKLCGKILQWQETVRYLGYDMNCRNRDEAEILIRRRELYANANRIHSRFNKCSSEVKLYLFRTYFSNVYGSSLWVAVNKKVLEKINVAYNNCFRLIMGYGRRESASGMFCKNRVRDFTAMRRTAAYSLLFRVANSDNVIVQAIVNSYVFTKSSVSKMWKSLLFNI